MILKIIGSAVAVASAILAAGAISSAEKRRTDQLYAFSKLVGHLGAQIKNFNSPVRDILGEADLTLLHACGAEVPDTDGFVSFLDSCDLSLSEEEKRALFSFAAELGRGFCDEQVKSCQIYSAHLLDLANSAARQLPQKRKVIYTLLVCSALALVIILI